MSVLSEPALYLALLLLALAAAIVAATYGRMQRLRWFAKRTEAMESGLSLCASVEALLAELQQTASIDAFTERVNVLNNIKGELAYIVHMLQYYKPRPLALLLDQDMAAIIEQEKRLNELQQQITSLMEHERRPS